MAELTVDQVSQDVRDLFNKGFAAFERGNLDYAIDLLFACVEREPQFLQARKYLRAAEIKKSKQKKSSALGNLISTVKGMPALAMAKSGKKGKDSLITAERLLRDDPLNVKFVKAFAEAAVAAGLPEAAIHTLEVARDHHPDHIGILNWLGALYQKVGRTKSARECFEALCALCPNNPDALKALKDALAVDSMSADGWQEAADSGGSYRDMIKDTDEAVRLEQEAKAVKTDRDADSLLEDALKKIENEPGNINYYRTAAGLYAQLKQFDEAMAVMQRAMEASPGDPELESAHQKLQVQQYEHRITMLREEGNEEAAVALENERNQFVFDSVQERVQRYPNDLKLRFEWGVMLFDNEYFKEAIQQFQMAQRSPSFRVRSLYYLAMCFKSKGQYDMAVEQLEQAAGELYTMDDTKKDIFYQIGEIAEIGGDHEKAADYYKRIYQVDISYRDIAEKIERVYQKSGNEDA